MSDEGLSRSIEAMRERGLHDAALTSFEHYYRELEQVLEHGGGVIPEDSIDPLTDVQRLGDLEFTDEELSQALEAVVMVKLNGGLGTSMGLTGPKTALVVKDGLTFLDVIAQQVLALREEHGVDLPLVLMNSFRTHEESLAILEKHEGIAVDGIPLDFLQNAEPKLRADDLMPVEHPADPSLEWCPPGHGDVYVALQTSGMLQTLRDKGFRYVFLSNADNLGATCDPRVPAWMSREGIPFVSEVCERTRNDRKGGHLAVRKSDGRLVLRESAMVVEGEEAHFQDNERHSTFNCNNIWVDLEVLERLLAERDGVLGLPIIVNRKTVDPSDKSSTKVIQIETAMGTAIETIEGAQALRVERDRFRPVKTTNELLLVRSDVFGLDEKSRIVKQTDAPDPYVDLDGDYFKLVPDFEERFAGGAPSLARCRSLEVSGDVRFGADVVCVGEVRVEGPRQVVDGETLEG